MGSKISCKLDDSRRSEHILLPCFNAGQKEEKLDNVA